MLLGLVPAEGDVKAVVLVRSFIRLFLFSLSKYFSVSYIPGPVSHIGYTAVDRTIPWS